MRMYDDLPYWKQRKLKKLWTQEFGSKSFGYRKKHPKIEDLIWYAEMLQVSVETLTNSLYRPKYTHCDLVREDQALASKYNMKAAA